MSRLSGGFAPCSAVADHSPEAAVGCCWCAAKCSIKCAPLLRTVGRPRPCQHWGFGRFPSPTTRPPRIDVRGRVRVVGLGAAWVWIEAGTGPAREVDLGVEAERKVEEKEDKKTSSQRRERQRQVSDARSSRRRRREGGGLGGRRGRLDCGVWTVVPECVSGCRVRRVGPWLVS